MKSNTRNYAISDVADFDIDEIIADAGNPEAILIESATAVLLLRQDFLSKFNSADNQLVLGTCLSSTWGQEVVSIEQAHWIPSRVVFAHTTGRMTFLRDYRARVLTLDEIGSLHVELAAAREYRRILTYTARAI